MKRHQISNLLPLLATIISSIIIYYSKLSLIGTFITIFGLIIWWISKITLSDAWSSLPEANKIVKSGIYSKIRHPIYLGFTITTIGWFIIIPSIFTFSIILSVSITFYFKIKAEEEILTNKFKEEYKKYKKNTWF